jgi:hypothetical protein
MMKKKMKTLFCKSITKQQRPFSRITAKKEIQDRRFKSIEDEIKIETPKEIARNWIKEITQKRSECKQILINRALKKARN